MKKDEDYDDVCTLDIMKHNTMEQWILGLNFFENYFTIFDQENR